MQLIGITILQSHSFVGHSAVGKGPTGKAPRREFRASASAGQRHETEWAEKDLQGGAPAGAYSVQLCIGFEREWRGRWQGYGFSSLCSSTCGIWDVRLGTQQARLRGNRQELAYKIKLVMSTAQRYHDPVISQHRKDLFPLAVSHAAYEPRGLVRSRSSFEATAEDWLPG